MNSEYQDFLRAKLPRAESFGVKDVAVPTGLFDFQKHCAQFALEKGRAAPITHNADDFPLEQWQEWASPVWMDTRETDVLNAERAPHDEKHICPMPLDLIKRAIALWSNPGDTVLSPFMGIGSEGVAALELRRRFVGVELKREYWQQACAHLKARDSQEVLFA